jgi:hypothetical protein
MDTPKSRMLFLFFFVCILLSSCRIRNNSKECETWTNRINVLKLCDNNRFFLDFGYHGYSKFNRYLNKPFYTGNYVKKLNKVVLLFDLPYSVMIEHDSLINGTEVIVESLIDSCTSKCHAFLKVVRKDEEEIIETDQRGFCKIKGDFKSLFISVRLTRCTERIPKEAIRNAFSIGELYWYPIETGFPMNNKRIFIRYYEEPYSFNKVKHKVILKRNRLKGYMIEDNFFVFYTMKKAKKIVIIEPDGKLNYYKEEN